MVEIQKNIARTMDSDPDGISDEETEKLPEIQSELDKLNQASTEINRLENELDEARSKYRSIITETSGKMEALLHDRKKSIHRAREYYRLKEEAKLAQGEALKAARLYQSATGVYKAAKETVALAECRLIEETDTPTAHLDSAWQEMLSHAISKVNEAEREKARSEQEHKRKATRYAELEGKIQLLEKKYGTSIKRSKAYFDLKAELDLKLMQQKHNVTDLQTAIKVNKMKYSESFHHLEAISDAIHLSRSNKIWSMFPRMPGVGSDTFSVSSGLSDLGIDHFGSAIDNTSKASDADTESSFEEADNKKEEKITGNCDPRKSSGSSLSTTVDNETNVKFSQARNAEEDKSDSARIDKLDRASAMQNSVEKEAAEEDKAVFENNSTAAQTDIVDSFKSIETGKEHITHVTNENAKIDPTEENSDEVFEEDYESCEEGEAPNQNDSEGEYDEKESADQTESITDNNICIDNAQILANGDHSGRKNDEEADKTSKGEEKHEKSENRHNADIGNKSTEESVKFQSENNSSTGDEYDSGEQDMRNIERPSISGAED